MFRCINIASGSKAAEIFILTNAALDALYFAGIGQVTFVPPINSTIVSDGGVQFKIVGIKHTNVIPEIELSVE